MVGWSMSLGESRALSQPGQKRQCQAALKFSQKPDRHAARVQLVACAGTGLRVM
jgi:hypothetical protein